jgi:cysteine-rich repeat protein
MFDPGEECDDGNTQSGDGCSSLCQLECGFTCSCGDPTKICQYVAKCGDGIRSSSEACDDGNQEDGDGCSANCQLEPHWQCRVPGKRCTPICGDGILLGTETCDDGNTLAGDGCGETCLIEGAGQYCGDGVISGGEECDEGVFNNDTSYGGCTTRCKYTFCGDGIVNGPEECDLGPGNNSSTYGDAQGCTGECTRPHYCGDGFVDSDYGEECDLGPLNGTNRYCTYDCRIIID